MVASLFLPWYVYEGPAGGRVLGAFSAKVGSVLPQTVYLGWICVLSAALALVALSMYKQRRRQMKFCAINFLAMTVSFLWAVYYERELFSNLPGPEGSYTYGAYAVVVAMICNWLARFFIRKDERLVESSDRLR